MYNVEGSEMDSLHLPSSFRYSEFAKNKETMHNSEQYNYVNNRNSASSKLTRYQSSPSSFLESLVDDVVVVAGDRDHINFYGSNDFKYAKGLEMDAVDDVSVGGRVDELFRGSSEGMENMNVKKNIIGNGNCSSLIQLSSSPAGFLSNLADDRGFIGTNDMRNLGSGNKTTNTNLSTTASRLGNYVNFSSGMSAHSRFMPQTAAPVYENIVTSEANGHNSGNSGRPSVSNFVSDSTFNSLKRNRDGEVKMLSYTNGLDMQLNDNPKHYTSGLMHQLSLPSTSAEMAKMENFLQFQQDDITPCKIRAKRGFATHPRSIAERVRRTRISARMKKLQDLFPKMDKQANTADMLDLAVVYIKNLQKEVQALNETRAKCTCPSKPK